MQAKDILHFWFDQLTDKQHFAKDAAMLECATSSQELAFLSEPGSSF